MDGQQRKPQRTGYTFTRGRGAPITAWYEGPDKALAAAVQDVRTRSAVPVRIIDAGGLTLVDADGIKAEAAKAAPARPAKSAGK